MKSPEKKLLYIVTRVFWSVSGGHETAIYQYSRGLHEMYGYDIDVYVFDDEKRIDIAAKPDFINNVFISAPIKRIEKAGNLIKRSLFGKDRLPIQCSLYYSKENAQRIKETVSKGGYDVIMVDMVRLAPYYDTFAFSGAKKILDIDDMLSKRYRRQLESLDEKTVIAGQYDEKLPGSIRKLLRSNLVKKRVLKSEIPRMENAERKYGQLYDNVIFVSETETNEYNEKYLGNKAVTVPFGVDMSYFAKDTGVQPESGVASFVGNMKTAANVDSVRLIIDRVIPHSKLLKRLDLIGPCPDELVKEYESNERVRFTGRVDDLRQYVKSTELFLSPLAYGSGIKTKILEAMAMGVPVITNSVGTEGIPGENGIHWYADDDPAKLAGYIDHLIENPDEGRRTGASGQRFVAENYRWETVFGQFSKLGLKEDRKC